MKTRKNNVSNVNEIINNQVNEVKQEVSNQAKENQQEQQQVIANLDNTKLSSIETSVNNLLKSESVSQICKGIIKLALDGNTDARELYEIVSKSKLDMSKSANEQYTLYLQGVQEYCKYKTREGQLLSKRTINTDLCEFVAIEGKRLVAEFVSKAYLNSLRHNRSKIFEVGKVYDSKSLEVVEKTTEEVEQIKADRKEEQQSKKAETEFYKAEQLLEQSGKKVVDPEQLVKVDDKYILKYLQVRGVSKETLLAVKDELKGSINNSSAQQKETLVS